MEKLRRHLKIHDAERTRDDLPGDGDRIQNQRTQYLLPGSRQEAQQNHAQQGGHDDHQRRLGLPGVVKRTIDGLAQHVHGMQYGHSRGGASTISGRPPGRTRRRPLCGSRRYAARRCAFLRSCSIR